MYWQYTAALTPSVLAATNPPIRSADTTAGSFITASTESIALIYFSVQMICMNIVS